MIKAEDLDFGSVAAEDERYLEEWFIETDEYREVINGKVNFILGLKGSGKSTIFEMLSKYKSENLIIIPGNSTKGPLEYESFLPKDENKENIVDKENILEYFRKIWKVYTSIVLGATLLENFQDSEKNDDLDYIRETLNTIGVVGRSGIREFLQQIKEISITIQTFAFKISSNGSSIEKKLDYKNLLSAEQQFLEEKKLEAWILFDKLDELFADENDKRKKALEGLLYAYSDLSELENIKLKIFLRTDIFNTLHFENKDHFYSTKIKWDESNLMTLIAKRIAKNNEIANKVLSHDEVSSNDINSEEARSLFYAVFEDKVEKGSHKSETFKWIYNRILDGQGIATPRDMIYFCKTARKSQISENYSVQQGRLISGKAVKHAFIEFSQDKLNNYLYQVFPQYIPIIEKFIGSPRPKFTLADLKKRLNIENENEAISKVKELCDIGFLKKKSNKPIEETEEFEVPYMYRPALEIKTAGRRKGEARSNKTYTMP